MNGGAAPVDGRMVYASLRSRLAAFGVDYLVVSVYIGLLVLVGLGLRRVASPEWFSATPLRGQLLGLLLLTLPVALYFAASERSERQATIGKRVLGLRVVGERGERLSWGRALLRSGVKFAPWELAHTCLWRIPGWPGTVETFPTAVVVGMAAVWLLIAFYLLAPLVDARNRTPYDWAARSRVTVDDGRRGDVGRAEVGHGEIGRREAARSAADRRVEGS